MFKYTLVCSIAGLSCLAITPWIARLAIAMGAVDRPGLRSVHSVPTPRLGGLAVFVSIVLGLTAGGLLDPVSESYARQLVILIATAGAIMLLGVADDWVSLRPSLKLGVEIVVALGAFAGGFRITNIQGVGVGQFAAPLTVLWILVVTNAFNLVDGLDGLATGMGAIISATLLALALGDAKIAAALVLAALCGSLFGFLRYNFFPAKIFLGDSGSLLLGFIFALVSIQIAEKASAALAISMSMLALGLPLTEVMLTITRRLLRGVRVVRGGFGGEHYEFVFLRRDALFTADRSHIHHRLLDLGITHRKAVLLLYGVCALFCGGAFVLVLRRGADQALILGTFAVAAVSGIRRLCYKELQPLRNGLLLPFLEAGVFNLRPFQVLVDIASITVAYLGSYYIWWETVPLAPFMPSVTRTLPLVCFAQVSCFALCGLYRRSHRLCEIEHLVALVKALLIAEIAGWGAHCYVFGWKPADGAILVLDTYLLATAMIGWRFSFSLLEYFFGLEPRKEIVESTVEDSTVGVNGQSGDPDASTRRVIERQPNRSGLGWG